MINLVIVLFVIYHDIQLYVVLFTYISWYLLWMFPIYIYLDICLLYNMIFINIIIFWVF